MKHYLFNRFSLLYACIILIVATGFFFLIPTESTLNWQVGFLFFSSLITPVLWTYLFFPITSMPFWNLGNFKSLKNYVFYRLFFLIVPWLALTIGFLVHHSLLSSFVLLPVFHALVSYIGFTGVGKQSLDWRTGKKGNSIRETAKETGQISVPLGSFPTLMRTFSAQIILVLSTLFLLNTSYLFLLGIILLSFLLLLIMKRISKNSGQLIKRFISDNAFFDEYFLIQDDSSEIKAVPYQSLFWIPKKIRNDARYLLTQHLRIYPVSRIYLSLHFVLWVLALLSLSFINPFYLIAFLLIILCIELHTFYSPSQGAYGRPLIRPFFSLFKIHFFIMIRWLPITLITCFIFLKHTFTFTNLTLFLILFFILNSLIQAYLQNQKTKQFYG